MPRCYAPLLCNTGSKNAGWGVLVPGFIEVVIYSFRIGSLGAFSPSKNTSWAYHFNACRPIFWLNQYPLQIKELLVPPLEVTGNVGRHWQERANAPPVTNSYEIHEKQRLCFASRSIPEGGVGKKKAQQSTFAARLPFQTCRVWNSAGPCWFRGVAAVPESKFSTMIPRLNCPEWFWDERDVAGGAAVSRCRTHNQKPRGAAGYQ